MKEILDRITKTMKEKGINQTALCKKLKVQNTVFTDWKSQRTTSYKKYLPQIAEVLNCTVEYLTTGKESEAEEFYRRFMNLPENLQQAIKFIMETENKK